MTSLFDDLPDFVATADAARAADVKTPAIDTRALLEGLNDQQRAAVLHGGAHC